MTTKILALTDALGNLCDFILLPGQRNDICGVRSLIEDKSFGALLADKAFDADRLIKELTQKGIEPVIPPRKGLSGYSSKISRNRARRWLLFKTIRC